MVRETFCRDRGEEVHSYCGSIMEDSERQRSKLDAANSEEYLFKIFNFGFAGS